MPWKNEAQRKLAIKRGRLKLMDLVDPEILITLPFVVPEPHELGSESQGALSKERPLADEEVVAISVAVHSALKEADGASGADGRRADMRGADMRGADAGGTNTRSGYKRVRETGDSEGGCGDLNGRNLQPEKLVKERYSRDF